jgi:hypothetical protein
VDICNKLYYIILYTKIYLYIIKLLWITETPIEPGVLNISRRTSLGLCPICDLNIIVPRYQIGVFHLYDIFIATAAMFNNLLDYQKKSLK